MNIDRIFMNYYNLLQQALILNTEDEALVKEETPQNNRLYTDD